MNARLSSIAVLFLLLASCEPVPLLFDKRPQSGLGEVPSVPEIPSVPEVPSVPDPLVAAGIPVRICPNRSDKAAVLTFDDGPSSNTDRLLELLEKSGARATFFLRADNLDVAHPDHVEHRLRVRRIQAAGHEICNHTHSHRALTTLGDDDVRAEMLKAEDLIAQETGRRTRCMRPPYTNYDDRVLGILAELDYRVILWRPDSADWLYASSEYPNEFDPSKVIDEIAKGLSVINGPLIHIQHDNEHTAASVELVPLVIDRIRDGGWEMITLSECLGGWIDKPL